MKLSKKSFTCKEQKTTSVFVYPSFQAEKVKSLAPTPFLQLIPQDVHSTVRHTGGSAVIRNGGFD